MQYLWFWLVLLVVREGSRVDREPVLVTKYGHHHCDQKHSLKPGPYLVPTLCLHNTSKLYARPFFLVGYCLNKDKRCPFFSYTRMPLPYALLAQPNDQLSCPHYIYHIKTLSFTYLLAYYITNSITIFIKIYSLLFTIVCMCYDQL